MFSDDRMCALVIQRVLTVNRIGSWVGRNCGRKIGYWVQSVFSWTVRTLSHK